MSRLHPAPLCFLLCRQIYPHTSFAQEVDFLQTMFNGSAYVHGPLNSDHWYTYVADDCKRPTISAADRTLNIMMYDLDPEAAKYFFKRDQVSATGHTRFARSCRTRSFSTSWVMHTHVMLSKPMSRDNIARNAPATV